jgi:hypothetical protein
VANVDAGIGVEAGAIVMAEGDVGLVITVGAWQPEEAATVTMPKNIQTRTLYGFFAMLTPGNVWQVARYLDCQ